MRYRQTDRQTDTHIQLPCNIETQSIKYMTQESISLEDTQTLQVLQATYIVDSNTFCRSVILPFTMLWWGTGACRKT